MSGWPWRRPTQLLLRDIAEIVQATAGIGSPWPKGEIGSTVEAGGIDVDLGTNEHRRSVLAAEPSELACGGTHQVDPKSWFLCLFFLRQPYLSKRN